MDMLENKNIKINQNTSTYKNTDRRKLLKSPLQILKNISNTSQGRNYHQILSNFITPLKENSKKINFNDRLIKKRRLLISAMDIETLNIDGRQVPICISVAYFYSESKLFLIDFDLIEKDLNKAIKQL
jgi:hypothetical protein